MTTVHLRHARALGYCARGVRDFFARHELDYRAFLREGTDADTLVATGDAMALKVVAEARREATAGGPVHGE